MFENIEKVIRMVKSPEFGRFMMIIGGIVVAFNLIRFIVVICKVKKAETYLYQGAEAFDGMAMGCGLIAIAGFVQGMLVVGILAAVFAFIFFCCDQKLTWLRHTNSAMQEAQDILDSTKIP